jgi:hypothetical protein
MAKEKKTANDKSAEKYSHYTQEELNGIQKNIWDDVLIFVPDANKYLTIKIKLIGDKNESFSQLYYNINDYCNNPTKELIKSILEKNVIAYKLAILTTTNFE